MDLKIYYASIPCSSIYKNGGKCKNKAYYFFDNSYRCGVHSKKNERIELPKNPNKERDKLRDISEQYKIIEKFKQDNFSNGKIGNVICSKLRMMKEVENIDGYLKVFPNFKHQNRKDGFGCSSLSPKSIGPIYHGQPDLPPAKNLENFHQGNKVFLSEVDKDKNPTKKFYECQIEFYNDVDAHRHKFTSKDKPLYSLWRRKNGDEVKMSYFESRQFYCAFYENIVKNLDDFKILQEKMNGGYNLQICGYDAYDVNTDIETCYKDTKKQFGHELVLYTMLVYPEEEYPWKKYKTEEYLEEIDDRKISQLTKDIFYPISKDDITVISTIIIYYLSKKYNDNFKYFIIKNDVEKEKYLNLVIETDKFGIKEIIRILSSKKILKNILYFDDNKLISICNLEKCNKNFILNLEKQ